MNMNRILTSALAAAAAVLAITLGATAAVQATQPTAEAQWVPAAQSVVPVSGLRVGDQLVSIVFGSDCLAKSAGHTWHGHKPGPHPVYALSRFRTHPSDVPARGVTVQTGPSSWSSITIPDACQATATVRR